MAKKPSKKTPARKTAVRRTTTPKAAFKPVPGRSSTPVRNTTAPRAAARQPITQDLIAKRAYEISISGRGGSEMENWLRAERELRGA